MVERRTTKPEIASQKRTIKFAPALGDWTTYKPTKVLVKKVKSGLYGFDRLSKEELKLAMILHYRLLEQLLKRFKIELKMAVEFFSLQVEQTTYLNFMRTLAGPVAQANINIPNWHDHINLTLDLSLANSIINYSVGSQDLEEINRSLTDAEQIALSTTINEYLDEYSQTFRQAVSQLSVNKITAPDANLDPSINTSATYVTFCAEVALADNQPGRIYFGYLGSTLKKLLSLYKQKQAALNFSQISQALRPKVIVPLKVVLGQTTLTTKEINQLEVGDVVLIDTALKSPVKLKLGKIIELTCQAGYKDSKIAVRLTNQRRTLEEPPGEEPTPMATEPPKTQETEPQPTQQQENDLAQEQPKSDTTNELEDIAEEEDVISEDPEFEANEDFSTEDSFDDNFSDDDFGEDDFGADDSSNDDEEFPSQEEEKNQEGGL